LGAFITLGAFTFLGALTAFGAVAADFAGFAGRFFGKGVEAACGLADFGTGFGFGLLTGRTVDFAGRAGVAFDAATVALDRGFKDGWAAFG